MSIEQVDTLIVGAGLSGIGSAVHLRQGLPQQSVLILEARERLGGTWDLFRYPGIRSDSDMHTLGYSFKPWTGAKAIADGPSILQYVQETAQEFGVLPLIRFGHKVLSADWDSAAARWRVAVKRLADDAVLQVQCRFLLMCSGYYNYAHGYTPALPGMDSFKGKVVHPQHWPQDLDYRGQQVVVIGSGATAMTLVPEMAKLAAHVTLLQRSPTYVVARPSRDAIADGLRRLLPAKIAFALTRWKNVLTGLFYFTLARRKPDLAKARILQGAAQALPAGYPVDPHFTPSYKPWDQRICLLPDGDLFGAISQGRARMVTDTIEMIEPQGLRLHSGELLPADVIVTATGLDLLGFGGMHIAVDGIALKVAECLSYKGMMLNGVPNFAYVFGYTNASWTLKSDLTGQYVLRLLRHMRSHGLDNAVPQLNDSTVQPESWVDFSSGYFQRAMDRFPKQGSKKPWRLYQNYVRDLLTLRWSALEDGVLQFGKAPPSAQ
jgi:cation diffusion facilitator CzcD-associated flavoprotein CzcO